jgi:CBS domain-containing membrane protein
MTCETVMLQNPFTVRDTATLSQALDILFQHRIKSIPVVDGQHIYRGLFGIHTLVRVLLPRAATLNEGSGLTDLTFVHDSLDTLKDRLAQRLPEPVTTFMDKALVPLTPDKSLQETLLLLHRHRHSLPVSDPVTGRLLGIVTYWEMLTHLTGRTG